MHEIPKINGEQGLSHHETITPMNLEEVTTYITKNWKSAPLPKGLPEAGHIECIDDRRTGHPNERGAGDLSDQSVRESIAYPGGALGVLGTLLAATNESTLGGETGTKIPLSAITTFFEKEFKGISCHTDSHNTGNERACAGCGHAAAMLANSAYGLGAEYQADLDAYVKNIQKRKAANDLSVSIYSYDGDHKARAVVRIIKEPSTDSYISLPPNDGENGMFVINEATDLNILTLAGKKMYLEFADTFKSAGIPEEKFLQNVAGAYGKQVELTAKKLAHGLPVYDLIGEGKEVRVTQSNLQF